MIPGQSKMGKTSMGFPDNDLRDVGKPKRVPGEGDQQSPEMGHLHTLRVSGSIASEFAVYIYIYRYVVNCILVNIKIYIYK